MKKTFLLIAAAILSMAAMAETTTVTITPNGDTWVRKNNTEAAKHGADKKMEVRTNYRTAKDVNGNDSVTKDEDFVGLLSFPMPMIALNAITDVKLVLTEERVKGDRGIKIFPLGMDFDESKVNYSDVENAIVEARKGTALANFNAKGEGNKACIIDAVSDAYKSVTAWQDTIDLTAYVSAYAGANLTLFISRVKTEQADPVCFFTKEQGDFTPTDGKGIALTAAEACPKLIITYDVALASPAILNATTKVGYETLKEAVDAAAAGDRILLNSDITVTGSRVDVKKALTIEGATGNETITCDVSENTIMLLSNGNEADYTLTIKNLTIDGNNTARNTQVIENGHDKSKIAFENVSIVNTVYADDVVCGDVKNNGSNIVLVGNNTFTNGIFLNRGKRIDNLSATHTTENPISIYLVSDYAENYAIVLNCGDAALYKAYDAAGEYNWTLTVAQSGEKKELKGTKTKKAGTAFEQVEEAEKVVKVVENGQVFILRNGVQYNILGAQF